jgi:hypothetical protein
MAGTVFIAGQWRSAAEGLAALQDRTAGFDFAFYFHVILLIVHFFRIAGTVFPPVGEDQRRKVSQRCRTGPPALTLLFTFMSFSETFTSHIELPATEFRHREGA